MHTIDDAYRAIIRLAKTKGKKRAALIERIMREETAHFTSEQYKKTGSAGMEYGKWSNLPNSVIGKVKMRDNKTKILKTFIVWNNVYDFCIYLSDYIDRYDGDWGRWNSTNPAVKYNYKVRVNKVRNRWIIDDSLSTKISEIRDDVVNSGYEAWDDVKDFFSPDSINTEVNKPAYQPIINKVKYQPKKLKPIPRTKIKEVKQVPAAGIWNIIKFVADQYSLSQTINDATINNNQGSLYNFIQKVVQKPWLQFFGTTLNSRYYFYCRKEPFDFEGWQNMPTLKVIKEKSVLSDNFKWYDGDIYSWYQLTPRGNFYTEQHLQFGYISAVFFEEFADIWGSKPLSQISNYVNYYKMPDEEKDIMHKKAMIDLKYMVESNCYLPFTRQGTITIDGDTSFKPGYKVEVESTQEIFYIDNVSHNFVNDEGNVRFVTTLQLSRGMKKKFIAYPKSKDVISYFNIINFDMKFEQLPGVSEEYKKPIVNWKVNRKVFDFFINKRQNGL